MKKIALSLFIPFLFLVTHGVASAAADITPGTPAESSDLIGYIQGFYSSVLSLAGIAAVVMIIFGAIYYAVSGAVDKKREGKEIIVSALWGLVLLFVAYIILHTINPQLVELAEPGLLEVSLPDTDPDESLSECQENVIAACLPVTVAITSSTAPETIYIVDCGGAWSGESCKESVVGMLEKVIQEGGQYARAALYPKNKDPETGGKCLNYAWKETGDGSWESARTTGLMRCPNF